MKNFFLISVIFLGLVSAVNAQENTPSFQDFLAQFPKASLPYTFSAQSLQAQIETRPVAKAAPLNWDFYNFLPELERSAAFSSMPVHPQPVAALETENYHAVIYNLARGLARGNKTYSISVFTKEGNYIGTHFVAGVNPEMLTAVTIDESLVANVTEYKISWAKDYRENGHIGNNITGLNFVEAGSFGLASAGNPDQIQWATCSVLSEMHLAKLK
jgi:hypothetical protein